MSSNREAESRIEALAEQRLDALHRSTDRFFALLMVLQWIAGVLAACFLSPRAWAGSTSQPHVHVWLAVILGGAISSLPILLSAVRPGAKSTRMVIAVGQALWSALLIHLTGGRIETHFHVFGSLAFLAFYRDVHVILAASTIVALDHILRGTYLPQSVFGVLAPGQWRWVEHAAWVVFEDVVLIYSCLRGKRELIAMSRAQCQVERFAETIEQEVVDRTQELQAAHDELVAAGRFKEAVYQALPGALLVFDRKDRIHASNHGVLELLGYEEAELIGQPVGFVFSAADAPSWAESERLAADAPSPRVEKVCRAKDGTPIPVLYSARLLGGGPDSERDVVCVLLDIRDRKKLEIQLRQNQKLESLGHLAAGIAHEINTPTQFVSDNTRFLQSSFDELIPLLESCARLPTEPAPEKELERLIAQVRAIDLTFARDEIPRAIADTLEGIARIAGIVRAMKEFSHPGSRSKEMVDLNRCVESTITVARNAWKYVARLETELAPDLPRVSCFPQDLNQVLLNVIVNAAQAIEEARTKRGGDTQELGLIRIVTRRAHDSVELRISDDGCGITEAIRARIFDPFFTTKEVGKGTGQGLALAHHVVVEKLGGRIDVESEVGRGSTFILHLPLTQTMEASAAA